jgi:RNA polymerase sigma factor (TIGR02999 family)
LARCACLRLKFGQWLRYAAWPPGIVALMRIDHASPCRPRSDQAPRSMSEITQLLQLVNEGDAVAREALFAALYQDLRQLARSRLRRSETITLLDTASLVHESYLRYLNARELSFDDRGKFFAYAASVMRSIVVDEVRKRHAERRGGSAEHVELDTGSTDAMATDDDQIVRVHEALDELAALEPRLARVVEMRYFAGLTETDIAGALGVTERTVRRDWDKARTLLFDALK